MSAKQVIPSTLNPRGGRSILFEPVTLNAIFRRRVLVALSVAAVVQLVACKGSSPSSPSQDVDTGSGIATMVGAGDIALCGGSGAKATAEILDGIEGTVFTAGDNVQEVGAAREYLECYDPAWGRHLNRTQPVPGNHDLATDGGAPYYAYFGERAGPAGLGYYSYDLGTWHVVALNSSLPTTSGTPQAQWLRTDLSANRRSCVLAYFHYPLYSSGKYAVPSMRDLWRTLYEFRVDVVINGHDHVYERFAAQDPDGRLDIGRGIRQFTVGTGGYGLFPLVSILPNSEAFQNHALGVLLLTLEPNAYSWRFLAVRGQSFTDVGSDRCVQ